MAKIKSKLIAILLGIIAVLVIAILIMLMGTKKHTAVSSSFISGKLQEASELTTAKLTYTGVAQYTDEGIPVINSADFTMVYNATIRAGIDAKKVETDVNEKAKTITIKIPDAEILDVKIDPNSIQYFDQKFSLFNTNEKEDANKAQALAEEDAKNNCAECGILELADQQAETLIKGVLEGFIDDYYVEFEHIENK